MSINAAVERGVDEPAAVPALAIVPPGDAILPSTPEQLNLRLLSLVEQLHAGQRQVVEELREIRTGLPQQRKPPSARTIAIHFAVVWLKRAGNCPACEQAAIADESGRLPGAEVDHHYARDKNKLHQVWPVCSVCNDRLRDTEYRSACHSAFTAYQGAVRQHLANRQLSLLEGQRGV